MCDERTYGVGCDTLALEALETLEEVIGVFKHDCQCMFRLLRREIYSFGRIG